MIENRPQADRILVARLSGASGRLSRFGALDDAQADAGAAELREMAGDRGDLLAEVAGISLGTAEGRGSEYAARAEAIARLCRTAGADPGCDLRVDRGRAAPVRGRAQVSGWRGSAGRPMG